MLTHSSAIKCIAFAAAALALAGCRQPSPEAMAQQATQELGLPVFLWAFSDDACTTNQLESLVREYSALSPAGRFELGARVRSTYNAIILVQSQQVGEKRGVLKRLQLLNSRGYVVSSKTISDTRLEELEAMPSMRVDKGSEADPQGKVLMLQPTFSKDRSSTVVYSTYSGVLYAEVKTDGDELARALEKGGVFESPRSAASAEDDCPAPVELQDLL